MTVFQSIRNGLIPAQLTADDLYALTEAGVLAENENIELIDGEVVPMAAAKADWHEIMKSRFIRALVPALDDTMRLYAEPTVTLGEKNVVEPDLVVWTKGMLPRSVRGPDLTLVIEVSDSSLSYDLRVKAPLYAVHGVREYWVVDVVRETVQVHRAPRAGRYTDVEEHDADVALMPHLLSGVSIQLDMLD